MMIYIAQNGAQQGPYPVAQINAMLAEGKLLPVDLAWWEGCAEWVPVLRAEGVVLPQTVAPAAVATLASAPVSSAVLAPALAPQASAASGPAPASVYAPPRGSLTPGGTMAGQVSAGTVQALKETRPWVKLIAIVGMIMTAIILIAMLAAASFGLFAARRSGGGLGGPEMLMMLPVMVVTGLLYVYPIFKLFKYSGAIGRLLQSGSVKDLEDAMVQQKSFWKFVGVLMLIVLLIYLVIFLAAIVMGGSASFMGGGGSPPSSFPAPAGPP